MLSGLREDWHHASGCAGAADVTICLHSLDETFMKLSGRGRMFLRKMRILTGSLRHLRSTQNKSVSMTEHIKIPAGSLSRTSFALWLLSLSISSGIFPHKQRQTLTLQSLITSVSRLDVI